MDIFIEQLLTSQKFDKLAERIAQKAVETILNLQPRLRFTEYNTTNSNIINSTIKSAASLKPDKHLAETSLKDLSLKYKRFSRPSTNNTTPTTEGKSTTKKVGTSKIEYSGEDEEIFLDIDDKLNETFNMKSNHQNKTKSSNALKGTKNIFHQMVPEEIEVDMNDDYDKDNSVTVENVKNDLDLLNEINSDNHHDSVEDNSGFDIKVDRDRDLFTNDSETLRSLEFNKQSTKRVRKEGNKIFTFLSSSDYDEYHAELDRVEKQRTVFV